jgi:replicative DNA helicase
MAKNEEKYFEGKSSYKKDNYNKDSYNNNLSFLGARIPPQDLDSEKALLGAIIISPESYLDIEDIVNEKSFYAEKHRIVWRNMVELNLKREPIDLISLNNKLKTKNELDSIGGAAYLAELANFVASATNIKYYANILKKKELLRRLIETSNKVANLSYEEKHEVEFVLETAEKEIYDITSHGSGSQKLIHLGALIEDAWQRIEKIHDTGEGLRGVPTGFKSLDNKLSGFQKSDLVILAARPSVGKSSLMLDFARHAAVKNNVHTAIFSLEMSKEQLFDRMLAAQSKVDGWKLRTGALSMENDIERLQAGLAQLSSAPIYIDDTAGNTIVNMRSVLRRLKAEKPIGLIIVDYLQLMNTSRLYENMVHQVSDISKSLKQLAKEFNAPVIALSQLSRNVEQRGGRPRLSDLRDSGSIEQDADVVMFIHREEKYGEANQQNNIVELLIEKHRNGATGTVKLMFDAKTTSFLEVADDGFSDFNMPVMNVSLNN